MRRNPWSFAAALAVAASFTLLGTSVSRAALVGYWPLDGDANDYSGAFSNHGTVMGGAAFDGDVPAAIGSGQSILLDGVDDYVDLGNNGGESGAYNFTTNDWTISGWVRLDSVARYTMFGNGGNDGGGIRTNVGWSESTGNNLPKMTTDDNLELDDGALGNDFGKQEITAVTDLGVGSWHHVVGQRKGFDILFFVDGVLESIETIPEAGSAPELPNGYDLTGLTQWPALVGANYRNSGVVQNFLPGRVDDVAVFDGALSPQQISQLASGMRTPANVESPGPALSVIASTGFEGVSGELGFTGGNVGNDPVNNTLVVDDDNVNSGSQSLHMDMTVNLPSAEPAIFEVEFDAVDLSLWTDVEVSVWMNGLQTSSRTYDAVPYESADVLEIWVEHDGGGPSSIYLARTKGSGNEGLNGMNGDDFFHLAGGVIPDDATTATLKMRLAVGGFDEDFHIDDVVFAGVAVPEPSSLMLALFGFAALIGSRIRRNGA
jgi:hypothetical protein